MRMVGRGGGVKFIGGNAREMNGDGNFSRNPGPEILFALEMKGPSLYTCTFEWGGFMIGLFECTVD